MANGTDNFVQMKDQGAVVVGKCTGMNDCMCPQRCKTKRCQGTCLCISVPNVTTGGPCASDSECVCPPGYKLSLCNLKDADCYCSDC